MTVKDRARLYRAFHGSPTCLEGAKSRCPQGTAHERPRPDRPALQAHAAVPARQGQDPLPQAHRHGVRVEKIMGRDMLVVEREAMRALAEAAFTDINHLLRPGHLKQLRTILDDQEASDNDKFVAYDFLKNANIAAGGVLPMCQDTGTAIIMGKKGGSCSPTATTRRRSPRARATPTSSAICATRSSRRSPCSRRRTPRSNMPAQVEIYAEQRPRRRIQVPVHRQGRRLRQQVVPVPGDAVDPHPRPHDRVPEGEDAHARHRRVPAVSPRDRHRRHLGRAHDEDGEARLCRYLDELPTKGSRGRPRLPRPRDGAGGAQAHAVARRRRAVRRQVFLPRRARDPAAAPRRLAADRARRVVLGRPPGARQDHPRRRLSRGARGAIRRSICPTSTRPRSAARSCRSTCAADEGDPRAARRSIRSRPGCRSPAR